MRQSRNIEILAKLKHSLNTSMRLIYRGSIGSQFEILSFHINSTLAIVENGIRLTKTVEYSLERAAIVLSIC